MKKGKKVKGNPRAKKPSGRSAPRRKWRPLEPGERILATDEVWGFARGPWVPVDRLVGCKFDPTFMNRVRREVRQPKAPVARRAKGSRA
jgi:hypothetical protein